MLMTCLILPLFAAVANGVAPRRDLYRCNKHLGCFDHALSFDARQATAEGFAVSPLNAESRLFISAKRPLSVCPFFKMESKWPDRTLAGCAKRLARRIPFSAQIDVNRFRPLMRITGAVAGFLSRAHPNEANYGL